QHHRRKWGETQCNLPRMETGTGYLCLISFPASFLGIVFIPGTSQLTAKDIFYRLQASKAKCIVVSDTLAPTVDSIASECKFLKTKLIVSNSSRDGWLSFKDLLQRHLASLVNPDFEDLNQGKREVPEYFNFASDVLDKWVQVEKAGKRPPNPAFWWVNDQKEEVKWSFEELALLSRKAANVLIGPCGLQRGDKAITVLPRIPEWWLLNVACMRTDSHKISSHYFLHSSHCIPDVGSIQSHKEISNCNNFLSRYKFMSLKHCVTGGEPLIPEVFEQWRKQTGLDIYEGYGQTETVTICANVKGMQIKVGSMGKASPPYDVQDNPEKTTATERGDFYTTGDRAIKDEEGYFWFVGRSDDVINSAGYRIGPFEVESALTEHPAVAESAVVSSPDPIRGEVIMVI
ncbi:hypothetical protein JD844_019813, partial [Phrynosoma platyrhinos]